MFNNSSDNFTLIAQDSQCRKFVVFSVFFASKIKDV